MSATLSPPPPKASSRVKPAATPSAAPSAPMPQPRRFSRAEYHQMGDQGFFRGQRAERIEGEIMVMAPQGFDHYFGTDSSQEQVKRAFGEGFWVRSQAPLELGLHSDPEPDLSVVPGGRLDYQSHPTTALLVVEVSESTLAYDRFEKASLYAQAGILDYWIVNLVERQVEVHRRPEPDPSQPFGFGYAERALFRAGQANAPLAKPDARIEVAPLLPPG